MKEKNDKVIIGKNHCVLSNSKIFKDFNSNKSIPFRMEAHPTGSIKTIEPMKKTSMIIRIIPKIIQKLLFRMSKEMLVN